MKGVRQPHYGAGELVRLGCLLLGFLLLSLLATGLPAKDRVVYYHNDALGSPVAATDVSGELLWREDYAPYGQRLRREDDGANRLWYTGKEEEAALGLYYFGARWYDAEIGRFLARDPAVFDEGNPQSFNNYAYANNNPYRYVDPNGAWAEDAVLAIPGLLVGGQSLADNVAKGNIISAAVDAVGILVDVAAAAVPVVPGGAGLAIKASRESVEAIGKAAANGAGVVDKGGLNLFKWGKETTTKADGWKEGDFMLHLPDRGSAKANWAQNAGRLREQMRQGNPIYDSYRDPVTGSQIATQGFLRAERNLLESGGWQFNPATGAYHSPSP